MSKKKEGRTAEEFMAELENDSEYVRRRAKKAEKFRLLTERLKVTENSILKRLDSAGFSADSVNSITEKYAPLPTVVVGILLESLGECSDERIQESLVRALATAEFPFDRQPLLKLFASTSSEPLALQFLTRFHLYARLRSVIGSKRSDKTFIFGKR